MFTAPSGSKTCAEQQEFPNSICPCTQALEQETGCCVPASQMATVQARLLAQCEVVKMDLSTKQRSNIYCMDLLDGRDLDLDVSREDFVNLNQELFDQCFEGDQYGKCGLDEIFGPAARTAYGNKVPPSACRNRRDRPLPCFCSVEGDAFAYRLCLPDSISSRAFPIRSFAKSVSGILLIERFVPISDGRNAGGR